MGYLTRFELEIKGEIPQNKELAAIANNMSLPAAVRNEALKSLDGDAVVLNRLNEIAGFNIKSYLGSSEPTKWYDHSKNMKELSLEFPAILFILDGNGEKSPDIWRAYYKAGKEQVAKAVITFEECKL